MMKHQLNNSDFIERAVSIHGNKYCYDNVVYITNRKPVEILCKIHGSFMQRPDNHLSGKGCKMCSKNVKMTLENFIKKASQIHCNKYCYDLVDMISTHKYVDIICYDHGIFKQTPNKHIIGKNGCPKCAGRNTDTAFFIEKANIIHNNKYNYSLVEYINAITKVIITCPLHGNFIQKPNNHLCGNGCYKCNINVSKKETNWLDSLPESNDLIRSYVVISNNKRVFFADAYNPKTNTIYEFYGDFWHGNPDIYKSSDINRVTKSSFGDLYQKTTNKEQIIKNLGYNLIFMWENKWNIDRK